MNLENDLRRALRRAQPPPGFADRVISLAAQSAPSPRPGTTRWWQFRSLVFATATATAVVIAGVAWQGHQQERSLEAQKQLITALNVTQASLQKAQQRIRRVAAKPPL